MAMVTLAVLSNCNGFSINRKLIPLRHTEIFSEPPRLIPFADAEIDALPEMAYDEVIAAAAYWGCKLDMKVLGPAYRVELRKSTWRRTGYKEGDYVNLETGETSAEMPEALAPTREFGGVVGDTDDVIMLEDRDLVGYTNGFVQPGGLLHLDTMQIRRFSGYWTKRKGYRGLDKDPKSTPNPGTYGLGLLLGGMAACFGREQGADRAQLLAIFDDPRQHQILVRYYRRLGFSELRDVGDELGSLGDRLTWGGVGKLMETDLSKWVKKFAPVIRNPSCGLL